MGLKGIFKKRKRPSTEGLQSGEQKFDKPAEIIFPPVDENGHFIQDRPLNGKW
jgi:hypothetical protein